MDFVKSMMIAAAGLKVQSGRLRVIAENLANADSVATTPGGDPYRRQIPTVTSKFDKALNARVVTLGKVDPDTTDFTRRLDPGNPAADSAGYVKYPNVQPLVEAVDMREAQRSYEANLNVITSTRQMVSKTLDILKS